MLALDFIILPFNGIAGVEPERSLPLRLTFYHSGHSVSSWLESIKRT